MRKLTFALNAHGPSFERYALLCIASIRHWCGDRVGIRVYEPDNLTPCSPNALAFFKRHNVDLVSFHNPWLPDHVEDLSSVAARHLTYNKLFTLLDVQLGEQRVFLDADQVLLGDPTDFLLQQQSPAGLVAADTPESFVGDWDQLYRDMGLEPPHHRVRMWSTYSYGQEPEPPRIDTHPYFCSGLVSVTDESTLPQFWLYFSEQLEHQIHSLQLSYFVDQVSLPLAVAATHQPWELLPMQCSVTPHVFRFIDHPLIFHYWCLDALAAQAARNPSLHAHLRLITEEIRQQTGIDMRFELLTQWPRWWRRAKGILNAQIRGLGIGIQSVERR